MWCLPVKKKANSRKVLYLTRAQVPVTIPNQKGLHHTITYMPVHCTVYSAHTRIISTWTKEKNMNVLNQIEDDVGQSHHFPLSEVLCDVGQHGETSKLLLIQPNSQPVNIARGTTDPGYWVYNLNHVSDWNLFEGGVTCIGSNFATRWRYLHWLQI